MPMVREIGDKSCPIWLLGDSNPKRWEAKLGGPLDPRHPVRHNIWTSILDVIQDRVYRERRLRLDSARVYIRNAIEDPDSKPPETRSNWSFAPAVLSEVAALRSLLDEHQPLLLLCFGSFAFEFARRSQGEHGLAFREWGTKKLGEEFRARITTCSPDRVNILPLLHRSIAGGKYLESHSYFCCDPGANYFEHVGGRIADILLACGALERLWVETNVMNPSGAAAGSFPPA